MGCATGHMDVISRFPDNPLGGLRLLLESLYLAGDDEELLDISMIVQRNRDARRDHAPQDAKGILCLSRIGQKLYRWSKEIDDQASCGIELSTHLFLSF